MLSFLHNFSFLIEAEVPFFGAIGGCPLSRGGGRMLTGKPLAFQEVAGPVKLPATSGRTRPLGSKEEEEEGPFFARFSDETFLTRCARKKKKDEIN